MFLLYIVNIIYQLVYNKKNRYSIMGVNDTCLNSKGVYTDGIIFNYSNWLFITFMPKCVYVH